MGNVAHAVQYKNWQVIKVVLLLHSVPPPSIVFFRGDTLGYLKDYGLEANRIGQLIVVLLML